MNTNQMPTKEETAAAADVLRRFAAASVPEPEEPAPLWPDETTEDELRDNYCVEGPLSYSGYWLAFAPRPDIDRAACAVYGYDGAGGLDKLLEVNGAITTGAAVRAAMDVIDNVNEF